MAAANPRPTAKRKIETSFGPEEDELVHLNVGGKHFDTWHSTLFRLTYFSEEVLRNHARDEDGCLFIDRDPKLFRRVLNAARSCTLPTRTNLDAFGPEMRAEFDFYGVARSEECVTVLTLSEETHKFYCGEWSSADTVTEFAQRISERAGIPADQLRLTFNKQKLDGQRQLSDYNIQYGAQLMLTLCLRGGKPLIMLYNFTPTPITVDVVVDLSEGWTFSALYPTPERPDERYRSAAAWRNVRVPPGAEGALEVDGVQMASLFWEADTTGRAELPFKLEPERAWLVRALQPLPDPGAKHGDDFASELPEALTRLLDCASLNTRERCEMITWWLPQMYAAAQSHNAEHIALQLASRVDIDTAARLLVQASSPLDALELRVAVHRVFLLWTSVPEWAAAHFPHRKWRDEYVEPSPARWTFHRLGDLLAIEWGGMHMPMPWLPPTECRRSI
jgi:hypothetical protein